VGYATSVVDCSGGFHSIEYYLPINQNIQISKDLANNENVQEIGGLANDALKKLLKEYIEEDKSNEGNK